MDSNVLGTYTTCRCVYKALTRTKRANERTYVHTKRTNEPASERINQPTNKQTGDQTEMINDAIA